MPAGRKRWSNPPVGRPHFPENYFEIFMEGYKPTIEHLVHEIFWRWYSQIRVPELRSEIRQTILYVVCREWFFYKNGYITEFPPRTKYLYHTTWFNLKAMFAPEDDPFLHAPRLDIDRSITDSILGDNESGNVISEDSLNQMINDAIEADKREKEERGFEYPDMLDLWSHGFTAGQLMVIYGFSKERINKYLFDYFEAMRPSRSRVRKNRATIQYLQKRPIRKRLLDRKKKWVIEKKGSK